MIGTVLQLFCDEEANDEVARREAGTHGMECFHIGDEFDAKFCGYRPERFALDKVHADIPAFGAVEREILAMDDLKAARNEEVAVIIHSP